MTSEKATLEERTAKHIANHHSITDQCDREFNRNRDDHRKKHGVLPSGIATATAGIEQYAAGCHIFIEQEHPDVTMARVMAKCAAHLALQYVVPLL